MKNLVMYAAQVAHETNRAWCEALGDTSQPTWDEAPDWQRESAIAGMEFHIANPNAGDSASHDSWMKQKLDDGWKYGKVKDPEKKTHPCLVPFEMLPQEQQIKDTLFRSVAHAILNIKPTQHQGLPVSGYQPQNEKTVTAVNINKHTEEMLLRIMDDLQLQNKEGKMDVDMRWLSIARTHIEQGFMAMNRAIFQPKRISLPEDVLDEI